MMRHLLKLSGYKRLIVRLGIFSVLSYLLFVFSQQKLSGTSLGVSTTPPTQPLYNFNNKIFYQDIQSAAITTPNSEYSIAAAVIPHHTFAGSMIAGLFSQLAHQQPKTIVLIGPNHWDLGSYKVLTGVQGWETPFGVLETDNVFIQSLVEKGIARVEDPILTNEHSVAAIMPYIKYYLPQVKIVPLILKSTVDLEDSRHLATQLTKFAEKDVVVVASVDFSHYLTSDQAAVKDIETLETITAFDKEGLFKFTSDNLDSPASIVTILDFVMQQGRTELSVLAHDNSGTMQNNPLIPTTSYFWLEYH